MALFLFAYREGPQGIAPLGCNHGGCHGYGIGAHRHSTDGPDPIVEHVKNSIGYRQSPASIEGGLTGIEVPGRDCPGPQLERPVSAYGMVAKVFYQRPNIP